MHLVGVASVTLVQLTILTDDGMLFAGSCAVIQGSRL